MRAASELVRGIGASEYPKLLGYVATTPKPRAETPLWTDKGDPLLAHWQYGLGRAVAFTSDAKARWGRIWLDWDKYRQFWSQIGQWSLRRLENADFTTEVTVDKGEGVINVEALDEQGNFRNFLNLQAIVVSPKGERQTVRLEQTGPGHYEARFPTKEVGAYLLNLMEIKDGQVRGSQVIGASVNYSPEFNASEPNLNLLRRLAETGGGKLLDPIDSSGEPLPARPAEDLPAARPLGMAAEVRHHSLHAGRRRAAHPDRPRRMAAGHASSAALALLLARRAAPAGGRGIAGRVAGPPRAGALAAARLRRPKPRPELFRPTNAPPCAVAGRRRRRRPAVANQRPARPNRPNRPTSTGTQHRQPPPRSQTPRPETPRLSGRVAWPPAAAVSSAPAWRRRAGR